MNTNNFIFLVISLFLISGCAPTYVPPPAPIITYSYPEIVTVDTNGVVIKAVDGSFQLTRGEVYNTPFFSGFCPNEPTTLDVDSTLQGGGQRVIVSHPGIDQDLYGVLAFCGLPNTLSGAVMRSYLVQVPQEYVDATSANRVSVVYEPVGDQARSCSNTCEYANDGECDDGGFGAVYSVCSLGTDCNDCGVRDGNRQAAWILFLSRIPL